MDKINELMHELNEHDLESLKNDIERKLEELNRECNQCCEKFKSTRSHYITIRTLIEQNSRGNDEERYDIDRFCSLECFNKWVSKNKSLACPYSKGKYDRYKWESSFNL